jgi:hypothetical protein
MVSLLAVVLVDVWVVLKVLSSAAVWVVLMADQMDATLVVQKAASKVGDWVLLWAVVLVVWKVE